MEFWNQGMDANADVVVAEEKRVLAQFKSEDGVLVGTPFDLPINVSQDSLSVLCNAVLENVWSWLFFNYGDCTVAACMLYYASTVYQLTDVHDVEKTWTGKLMACY